MPVVVLVILIILGVSYCTDGKGIRTAEGEKLSAWTYCQILVENSLRAPKTAEFPWKMEVDVSPDGKTYTVNSYVDAQNGFGALIRTRYHCQLHGSDADGWVVKKFRVLE